ncbi:hypothetical protein [Candidatus Marithrix sp. Canyon 246]|uniref:hypothetical protein n=1 Tax=Candidatus Marithrix sp. Canyon 246 TaxID=1827136 RepID=UPI00084A275B|nr:hypothetical protein [Candidatus Marithrix sp. Canyon 246]
MQAKKATEFIDIQDNSEKSTEVSDKDEEALTNLPHYKMTKPEEFSPESQIFYERIKRIFELRRNNRGIEPKTFPTYEHEYPDGRIVDAKLYSDLTGF